MTPLWRKAFDAIERPLAAGSESWVQSDTFMDLAAVTFRVQRRLLGEVQQNTARWLHLWGWVSRGDVLRLSNQVASLERQVRELQQNAEYRDRPLLDGHRSRSRRRARQSASGEGAVRASGETASGEGAVRASGETASGEGAVTAPEETS